MSINMNDEKLFSLSVEKKSDDEVNSQIKELTEKAKSRVDNDYDTDSYIYPELSYERETNKISLIVYRKR